MREDDNKWPPPDRVGKQELEIKLKGDHVCFNTTKLGSVLQVQQSQDPDGLRIFYYLVQVRGVAVVVLCCAVCCVRAAHAVCSRRCRARCVCAAQRQACMLSGSCFFTPTARSTPHAHKQRTHAHNTTHQHTRTSSALSSRSSARTSRSSRSRSSDCCVCVRRRRGVVL